ncbi:MAG: toxin-antitoxin system YwqK family antitoxin [Flavobacteriaceae bacterium]|nr:toxin-antitoxin system YwqK family antitoxin [Flavobacteriaceae bacterium]
MKKLVLLFAHFFVAIVFAQNINQFDADGNRHGIWKKNFDGTQQIRYEGEFSHGKEIGLFKFYILVKKKSVLSATKLFNSNDDSAEVKFLTSIGKTISEGKMVGKTYVGKWIYYHKNSDKIMTVETYDDKGVLQGERLVYYDNGQLAEKATYVNGKIEGLSEVYSLKGVVLKSFIYENGELHGPAKSFNGKGELLSEGQYKRNKKTGIWKYYENNKLVDEKNFTYVPKLQKKNN